MNNLLEYLDMAVERVPDKTAFSDGEAGITFREMDSRARSVGTVLAGRGIYREPVVVYMKKHPDMINAFFGVLMSGCYYVPIDEEMPVYRIALIMETVRPRAVICDETTLERAKETAKDADILLYAELLAEEPHEEMLSEIRRKALDIDPCYIVFTSGSTGVPKGVAACHRSVIDYIETLSEVLEFDGDTVFGNQTPLYFDACLKEIYPTLKYGATTYLIPKQLFSFPVKLVEFLNAHRINTICWVVSALTIVSSFGTFDEIRPEYLKRVAFGSEVFPAKQLNLWRKAVPQATFTNLYGPTEATGMCCYYRVERDFEPGEPVPIGGPFRNTEILLLTKEGRPAGEGEEGEICVRGTSVTLGYFRNPERTAESFVQNPLCTAYPEVIYRTGDLARRNERGELIFLSRMDDQIKHMGHRIELGEIEAVAAERDGVRSVCAVFDPDRRKIGLYYTGDAEERQLSAELREILPRYMLPHSVLRLSAMPYTPNGKVDRKLLKEEFSAGRKNRGGERTGRNG